MVRNEKIILPTRSPFLFRGEALALQQMSSGTSDFPISPGPQVREVTIEPSEGLSKGHPSRQFSISFPHHSFIFTNPTFYYYLAFTHPLFCCLLQGLLFIA